MNKLMYREWLPQIMYNHHQTGPAGTVIFTPPFRDPFNYNFDPDDRGRRSTWSAPIMHHALPAGRQAGLHDALGLELLDVVERRPAHDGLLPEHHRHPDRDHRQPDADARIAVHTRAIALPRGDLPAPIEPQEWHFRQSIDYSVTANYAVLDFASRYERPVPLQHLQDGLGPDRARQRGSLDDHAAQDAKVAWHCGRTVRGRGRQAAAARRRRGGAAAAAGRRSRCGRGGAGAGAAARWRTRRRRAVAAVVAAAAAAARGALRGAHDEGAARSARLHHAGGSAGLRDGRAIHQRAAQVGVAVQQATAPFTVNGKKYPAGSLVVKTAQASGRTCWTCSSRRITRTTSRTGRAAARALRQRRLDARVPDGREVRSRCSTRSTVRSRSLDGSSARKSRRAGARSKEPGAGARRRLLLQATRRPTASSSSIA